MPSLSQFESRIGYVPTILMELKKGTKADPVAKRFGKELGKLADKVVDRWDAMSLKEKLRRWDLRLHQHLRGDFSTRIATLSQLHKAERARFVSERRKIVRAEYERMLELGFERYHPSDQILKDRMLLHDAYKEFMNRTGANGCRCEKPGVTEPPPPKKKHGVVTYRLKCFDQCESGHDEVYMVSVAVDGNGNYIAKVSDRYPIDDDDDDVKYPRHWVYPTQDAGGFLDVAIRLMEDDGGYDDTAKQIGKLGGAVSTLGTAIGNPIVIGAGAAIAIIGGVVGLISALDDDEDYGVRYKTWPNQAALEAAPGNYVLNYAGEDWIGDNFEFDLSIQVVEA